MMTRPKINFIAHLKARLAIMLSIVSLASSCGMKSEVEVASSCGKPTDPACRKAVVKTDFNDVTTLTMRVPRPTISWPPEEKASKIAAEYLVRTSAEQPSRQELGTSDTRYTSSTSLTDGTYEFYIWKRTQGRGSWAAFKHYRLIIDSTPPKITSVSAMTSNGTYAQGATIDLQINFSEAVTLNGNAAISLSSGGTASYVSGSGTSSLAFRYIIGGSDGSSSFLDVLDKNAMNITKSITDTAGNAANLTLPKGSDSGALPMSSQIMVGGSAAPGAPQISVATSSFNAAFSTNISQNATADINFKEFRYTTTGTDPTCSTGTASTAQPTTVNIPAATTTLKAITCDLAGNSSVVTTATYTYDNTPPTAPTVTSASGYLASTSVTWTWTAGIGGNGNFRYKLNSTDLTTGATTTATTTASLTSLAQGTNTLYVQERDVAGNWSESGSYVVVVDTTAPGAPQISVATRSFNTAFSTNISQNATTDINFKAFRYSTTGVDPTCSTGTASTAQPTVVNIPASNTTLKAITCDHAGNISAVTTATYTYDNTPPAAPSVTSGSSTSPSSTVTWTWNPGGGGNDTYRYKLDSTDMASGTATTFKTATFNSLTNGAHTLYVQEQDDAGNWSASGSFTVTVSTSASISDPVIITTSPGRTLQPFVRFNLTAPAAVRLFKDNICNEPISSSVNFTSSGIQFMQTDVLSSNQQTTIYGKTSSGTCVSFGTYTHDIVAPPQPSSLNGSYNGSHFTVNLTWSIVTGASGYIVVRWPGAYSLFTPTAGVDYQLGPLGTDGQVVCVSTTNTCADTGVPAGQDFYYTLFAKDDALNWSTGKTWSVSTSGGSGPLTIDSNTSRASDWAYITWTGGKAPFAATLYSNNTCLISYRAQSTYPLNKIFLSGLTSPPAALYVKIKDTNDAYSSCFLVTTTSLSSLALSISETTSRSITLSFPAQSNPMELWQYQGQNCTNNPSLVGDIPAGVTTFNRIGLVAQAPTSSGYSFRIKNGASVSNCVSGEASNLSETFARAADLLVGSSTAPNAPYVVRIGEDNSCLGTVTPIDYYLSPNQFSLVYNLQPVPSYIQITDKDGRSSCHYHPYAIGLTLPDSVNLSGSSTKTLDWNDISGATSYKVIRFSKASCAGPGTQLTELPSGTSIYMDNSPPSVASYIVTVQQSTGARFFSDCK